jgi:hypothetical protein
MNTPARHRAHRKKKCGMPRTILFLPPAFVCLDEKSDREENIAYSFSRRKEAFSEAVSAADTMPQREP